MRGFRRPNIWLPRTGTPGRRMPIRLFWVVISYAVVPRPEGSVRPWRPSSGRGSSIVDRLGVDVTGRRACSRGGTGPSQGGLNQRGTRLLSGRAPVRFRLGAFDSLSPGRPRRARNHDNLGTLPIRAVIRVARRLVHLAGRGIRRRIHLWVHVYTGDRAASWPPPVSLRYTSANGRSPRARQGLTNPKARALAKNSFCLPPHRASGMAADYRSAFLRRVSPA